MPEFSRPGRQRPPWRLRALPPFRSACMTREARAWPRPLIRDGGDDDPGCLPGAATASRYEFRLLGSFRSGPGSRWRGAISAPVHEGSRRVERCLWRRWNIGDEGTMQELHRDTAPGVGVASLEDFVHSGPGNRTHQLVAIQYRNTEPSTVVGTRIESTIPAKALSQRKRFPSGSRTCKQVCLKLIVSSPRAHGAWHCRCHRLCDMRTCASHFGIRSRKVRKFAARRLKTGHIEASR